MDRYFPTEELEGVPTAPAVAAVMAEQQSGSQPLAIGEETGLPFIGYTYKRLYENLLLYSFSGVLANFRVVCSEHLNRHGGL